MRKFTRAVLCGLFASSFAFVACDDDDTKTPADTNQPADTADTNQPADTAQPDDVADTAMPGDTEADTAMPGDTAADTAMPGDTAADTTPQEDGTPAGGACDNASDLAVIGNEATDPADKATACGTSSTCITLALGGKITEFEECTRACMLDANRPNFTFVVSEACTECYVDSVRCTATECLGQCAADPSSSGCVTCREEKGCTPDFYTCSGLPQPQ